MSTDIEKVETEALTIVDEATTMVIIDNEGLEIAANLLLGIKDLRKKIADTFDPIIDKAHKAHKEAIAQKKKTEAPLVEAERIIKPKMGKYREQQDRERQAEIRRQEELARKAMEEQQLQDAIEADLSGNKEEAEAILDDELMPVPTPKVEKPMKPEGIAFRENWSFEIVDVNKIPRAYMMPNEKLIGSTVRLIKNKVAAEKTIPGIRVSMEKVPYGRG